MLILKSLSLWGYLWVLNLVFLLYSSRFKGLNLHLKTERRFWDQQMFVYSIKE